MPYAEPIPVKRADVEPLVRATFPEYRGRKIRVQPRERVTFSSLNWEGGSRSQYRACTLTGQWTGSAAKYNAQAPWANQAEGKSVDIPPGACIVEHVMFCGKDLGLRIYVRPEDMPRLLTVGA